MVGAGLPAKAFMGFHVPAEIIRGQGRSYGAIYLRAGSVMRPCCVLLSFFRAEDPVAIAKVADDGGGEYAGEKT